MTPGREVRLKNAYIVKCTGFQKDENGNVTEVYAEYDPETRTGLPGSNRKVKGTIHWLSANHCEKAEVRLYDRLFTDENPSDIKDKTLAELLNPDSLQIIKDCRIEPFLANAKPGEHFQFQRTGYFTVDPDSKPGALVFNRTVSLKDSWKKEQNK